MGIFKPKKIEVETPALAPEEPETNAEIEHIENLTNENKTEKVTVKKEVKEPTINYTEVPVCMSQEQINNLVIENNIMLKQIIANMD